MEGAVLPAFAMVAGADFAVKMARLNPGIEHELEWEAARAFYEDDEVDLARVRELITDQEAEEAYDSFSEFEEEEHELRLDHRSGTGFGIPRPRFNLPQCNVSDDVARDTRLFTGIHFCFFGFRAPIVLS